MQSRRTLTLSLLRREKGTLGGTVSGSPNRGPTQVRSRSPLPARSGEFSPLPHGTRKCAGSGMNSALQVRSNSLNSMAVHPGPLPSNGRGRIVLSPSAYPTALEAARDPSGCSLSRQTGEGQGEGRFVRNALPIRQLFLHKPSGYFFDPPITRAKSAQLSTLP